MTDSLCRPLAFLLTGGNVADCTAAEMLLDRLPAATLLHGAMGYDSDAVRRNIETMGVAPGIPPKSDRRGNLCFSPVLNRDRNAIERMFNPLKDYRRLATRYDRLTQNFRAAVCLAPTVSYWS